MAVTQLPNTGTWYDWDLGAAWKTEHTANLKLLDTILQGAVEDRDLTTAPVSPVDGERHIMAGAGGGWSGGATNRIAVYIESGWEFLIPKEGWTFYVRDEDIHVVWNGSAWVQTGGGITGITLEDEGVTVAGGPHTTLNFVGSLVAVSNIGGGEAQITVSGITGVNIEEEGGAVAGGPHDTINFVGSTVTATDAGGGQVDVTITAPTVAGAPNAVVDGGTFTSPGSLIDGGSFV